jgi:hypothetical protein
MPPPAYRYRLGDGAGEPVAQPVMLREDDTRAAWAAGLGLLLSAGLVLSGSIVMFQNPGQRFALTTLEPFHGWGALTGAFRDTWSVDPRYNPPSLEHARFVTAEGSLEHVSDLHERGLISDAHFANVSARFNATTGLPLGQIPMADYELLLQLAANFASALQLKGLPLPPFQSTPSAAAADPRLLSRVLAVSGCSFPDAPVGTTPVTRSPGCRCIGDAYVAFVRDAENMTSNITVAVRDAGADRVMRCLDRRVGWRSWGVGHRWSIHPLALAVFADAVFLLLCAAFLLSFFHAHYLPDSWLAGRRTVAIKGILVVLGLGLASIFVARDWQGNLLPLLGLACALWNLLLCANEALDYVGRGDGEGHVLLEDDEKEPTPHPLMLCFWLNVPLLLAAMLTIVAIANFVRDTYALMVVIGGAYLLGLLMQARHAFGVFVCIFSCLTLRSHSAYSGASGRWQRTLQTVWCRRSFWPSWTSTWGSCGSARITAGTGTACSCCRARGAWCPSLCTACS